MRIIGTFLFVLTVGILSLTVVLAHNPSQKDLFQSIFELNSINGSADSNISDRTMKAIDNLLKESCEKNGGLKAYSSAKKGWKYFLNCTERAESEMNQIPYVAKKDLVIMLKKTCALSEETCLKQLENSIEPCLEPEEHESTKIIYNIVKSSIKFICDEDGARIAKFFNDGGEQCFKSKKQALRNCLKEFSTLHPLATSSGGESAIGILSQAHTLIANVEDCMHIDELQHCIVNVLKTCEPHAPADITDSLFNSVKKIIDCKNLRKSRSSAFSLVNCASMTIVMAIVVRLIIYC